MESTRYLFFPCHACVHVQVVASFTLRLPYLLHLFPAQSPNFVLNPELKIRLGSCGSVRLAKPRKQRSGVGREERIRASLYLPNDALVLIVHILFVFPLPTENSMLSSFPFVPSVSRPSMHSSVDTLTSCIPRPHLYSYSYS